MSHKKLGHNILGIRLNINYRAFMQELKLSPSAKRLHSLTLQNIRSGLRALPIHRQDLDSTECLSGLDPGCQRESLGSHIFLEGDSPYLKCSSSIIK